MSLYHVIDGKPWEVMIYCVELARHSLAVTCILEGVIGAGVRHGVSINDQFHEK